MGETVVNESPIIDVGMRLQQDSCSVCGGVAVLRNLSMVIKLKTGYRVYASASQYSPSIFNSKVQNRYECSCYLDTYHCYDSLVVWIFELSTEMVLNARCTHIWHHGYLSLSALPSC